MASFVARLPPFDYESRPYAWTVDSTQNVYKFWVGFFGDTKLSKVMQALNSMVLSAGSAERNWSVRGGIHTTKRNRLSVANASKQTFIKHNLRLFATLNGKNVPQPLVYYSDDSDASEDSDIECDSNENNPTEAAAEFDSNENNPAEADTEEDLFVLN